MSGDKNLARLLASLSPELVDGEFVFCTFEQSHYGDHADLNPLAAMSEREGLTLVIPKAAADGQGLHYENVFKCITLGAHSSLEAVGLTAALSTRLTDLGISANVIAGYFHDHIFVPHERAIDALASLQELAHENSAA
ncbi:MAG: ACT domain-containing protein [Halioglobus sp.]|nr:ACT domain-containing protein [Halioglobus sp.]